MALDGHLVCLERQPAEPAVGSTAGEGLLDHAVDGQFQVGAVPGGSQRVPRIGGQHARPVGGQQERGVRAGQTGEIAHIDQAGDERGVGAETDHYFPQPLAARSGSADRSTAAGTTRPKTSRTALLAE